MNFLGNSFTRSHWPRTERPLFVVAGPGTPAECRTCPCAQNLGLISALHANRFDTVFGRIFAIPLFSASLIMAPQMLAFRIVVNSIWRTYAKDRIFTARDRCLPERDAFCRHNFSPDLPRHSRRQLRVLGDWKWRCRLLAHRDWRQHDHNRINNRNRNDHRNGNDDHEYNDWVFQYRTRAVVGWCSRHPTFRIRRKFVLRRRREHPRQFHGARRDGDDGWNLCGEFRLHHHGYTDRYVRDQNDCDDFTRTRFR